MKNHSPQTCMSCRADSRQTRDSFPPAQAPGRQTELGSYYILHHYQSPYFAVFSYHCNFCSLNGVYHDDFIFPTIKRNLRNGVFTCNCTECWNKLSIALKYLGKQSSMCFPIWITWLFGKFLYFVLSRRSLHSCMHVCCVMHTILFNIITSGKYLGQIEQRRNSDKLFTKCYWFKLCYRLSAKSI